VSHVVNSKEVVMNLVTNRCQHEEVNWLGPNRCQCRQCHKLGHWFEKAGLVMWYRGQEEPQQVIVQLPIPDHQELFPQPVTESVG